MPGVASHSVLRHLLEVCHTRTSEMRIRPVFAVVIPLLLASERRVIQDGILDTGKNATVQKGTLSMRVNAAPADVYGSTVAFMTIPAVPPRMIVAGIQVAQKNLETLELHANSERILDA